MSIEGVLQIVSAFFYVLGGMTVFMIGMDILGSNLEKAAGSKMRTLIGKATKNKFVGIATGTAITAIIQSSSATTVMVVGFVNIGMMTLIQATSIIMGANIGTTMTAFLSALSMGGAELEVSAVFAFIAFVGLMMTLFAREEKTKRIGFILAGLGMIFVGLYTMSFSVTGLTEGDGEVPTAIRGMFAAIGYGKTTLSWEILVLFLLGLVLTGIMQSSSAITAIVITLASSNLISLHMALFIVLGTNIGTCFTAVLSSIGTTIGIGGAIFFGEKWRVLDPIAAAVVSLFIFKVAVELIKPGFDELLEKSLPKDIEDRIIKAALSVDGVSQPHNLRTRKIGNKYAIDLHIRLDCDLTLREAHDIATEVENRIRAELCNDTYVNIHVEPLKQS